MGKQKKKEDENSILSLLLPPPVNLIELTLLLTRKKNFGSPLVECFHKKGKKIRNEREIETEREGERERETRRETVTDSDRKNRLATTTVFIY